MLDDDAQKLSSQAAADKAFSAKGSQGQPSSAKLLEAEEEYLLAVRWRDERDVDAMHKIVNAHRPLVMGTVKPFLKYARDYESRQDLIQEAQAGLLKATDKFDPDHGVRFSTYARWWIKAGVQEYVMRNHSMVRIGSTAAQKSLFFNLRRVEAHVNKKYKDMEEGEKIEKIASYLGVKEAEVIMMRGRIKHDHSLNAPQGKADEDGAREWIETVEGDEPMTEDQVAEKDELNVRKAFLVEALSGLNDREIDIIRRRKLQDKPDTLEDLGIDHGVSKERIRQIEAVAFGKLQKKMINLAEERGLGVSEDISSTSNSGSSPKGRKATP